MRSRKKDPPKLDYRVLKDRNVINSLNRSSDMQDDYERASAPASSTRVDMPFPRNTFPTKEFEQRLPKKSKDDEGSDMESLVMDIAELIDPTGITSWDDAKGAWDETFGQGKMPDLTTKQGVEQALDMFGAVPMAGKIAKFGKIMKAFNRYKNIGYKIHPLDAAAKLLTPNALDAAGFAMDRDDDPYESFSLKKYKQGGKFKVGDPKKHQKKISAVGPDDRTIYVPMEGMDDDPENYLNLARMDSIVESQHDGYLPFSAFRDQVRRVEAGPNSPDPYRQRQEVKFNGELLEIGVGRGAYQFDYPTAQTAYTRLKSIANKRGLDYPALSDEDLKDVSKLDPEIQDMLFTAHFAKDPVTSVRDVLMDEDNWADQWQIGHYKGKKDRRDHFRSLQ